MKTKIIYAAMSVLMWTACNESKYELENLVPEEYHKVLSFKNSGTADLTLYDTGEDNTYTLSVYKGGSDPDLTASVDIRTLTQEALDSLYSVPEAKNYKALGAECFSLDYPRVDFKSGERYKIVTVSIKVENVQNSIQKEPEATWVLPFYLSSAENDSINADKNEVFIKIKEVLTPTVGFTTSSIVYASYEYGFSVDTAKVEYGLDTDNRWDIECNFAVDLDYVKEYNEKNGTSFAVLPEGRYSLSETGKLPSGTKTSELPVLIDGKGLEPGEYMLPVRMAKASLFDVSQNSVVPLVIRVFGKRLDRAGWSITANTEEKSGEGAGNGIAKCVLDGDLNTFWHSQWSGGSVALPHELVIDVKKTVTFSNIGLQQRQHSDYRDVKAGVFYVSSDNENWVEVGSFNMEKILEEQIFFIHPTKGRYFKVLITESNRNGSSSLSELYAYGTE